MAEIVTHYSWTGELTARRPPRQGVFVAEVSWSWGPCHSRQERYVLVRSRRHRAWVLWVSTSLDGKLISGPVAACDLCIASIETIAVALVKEAWRGERANSGSLEPVEDVFLEEAGILDAGQIAAVARDLAIEEDRLVSEWLTSRQSAVVPDQAS